MQQKLQDDLIHYRSAVRAHKLVVQGDTRATFNIINGIDRPAPVPPSISEYTGLYPPGNGSGRQ